MKVTSLSQWEKSYLKNIFEDSYIKNLIEKLSKESDPIKKMEIVSSLYEVTVKELEKNKQKPQKRLNLIKK